MFALVQWKKILTDRTFGLVHVLVNVSLNILLTKINKCFGSIFHCLFMLTNVNKYLLPLT